MPSRLTGRLSEERKKKMQKLDLLLAVCFTLALTIVPAQANGTGALDVPEISGRVTQAGSDEGISGVDIVLLGEANGESVVIARRTSEEGGRYYMSEHSMLNWTDRSVALVASAQGYQNWRTTFDFDGSKQIDIELTPESNDGSDRAFNFAMPSIMVKASRILATEPQIGSVESVYTNLTGSGCTRWRQTAEVESERTCRGVAGYRLLILNMDERASINVIAPNGRRHQLDLPGTVSGSGFSSLGDRAEWRVTRRNGRIVPTALIVRVNAQSGETNTQTSYLAVVKITPQRICVTDRIAPGADANNQARQAADSSANRPCLEGLQQ
jgi:hypothetical protein